jgi:hypothetical protein
LGRAREFCFARIVPPPFDIGDYHVAVTTPYIIIGSSVDDWAAYFGRMIPRFGMAPPVASYVELMKYGVVPDYWSEYIFQAYSNFQNNAIFLHGIPDKPKSLPHFDPESTLDMNLSKVQTENERKEMKKRGARKYRGKSNTYVMTRVFMLKLEQTE